jgi:YggT family protein
MTALHVVVDVLQVFELLLVIRLIFSWVFMFARSWRPSGWGAAGLEVVYSATDPPLKFVRRFVPPLRLGGMALDLSFIIVFLAVIIAISVLNHFQPQTAPTGFQR